MDLAEASEARDAVGREPQMRPGSGEANESGGAVRDESKSAPEKAAERETQASDKRGAEKKSFLQMMKRRPWTSAIVVVLILAIVAAGVLWWLTTRDYESTDDAFIDGRPVAISALVAGAVTDVPVNDNQLVAPGNVLARIDDRDYIAAQDQAKALVAQAQAGIANVDAQIGTQQARIDQTARQVTEAQAALTFSKDENTRYQDLVQKGAGTVQRAQQATSDLQSKQAALDAALAAASEAERQIGVLRAQRESGEAQVRQAKAQSDQAGANLSRTVLVAPVQGRVTRLTGAAGAYAAPGQTLMILVPTELWVTANFKETQLADMRPGQLVTIEIDAYGRTFSGHVDSLQTGSGTAFSLLPAENATGNYVKIVQRVPVKIVFDKPPDVVIGPGMSVVPSVKAR
jgi:membrane fusion protein (multidrug efflux system)